MFPLVHLRCIAKEYSIGSFAKQIYHTVQLIIKQLAKVGMNKTTAEKYHRKYKGSVKRTQKQSKFTNPKFRTIICPLRPCEESPPEITLPHLQEKIKRWKRDTT